ncbi:hypothetical protein M569_01740 [Genlisea aurea]|uniref:Uncharacterized protein n=1 Tax=Genlisea aurea TaxID=192259 RepID=S8EK87_9LAMI|nr:hypothetical protein M569_01740 [Genlisea aurea]
MNRDEPSDDLSKIRGEILSSGDPFTLPRTDTCTECSYGKVDSWVWLLREILSFSSTQGGADTPARITGIIIPVLGGGDHSQEPKRLS